MLMTLRPIVTIALVAILAVLHPSLALAGDNVHVGSWDRIAPLLPGLRVTIELTDRERVHGRVLSAAPDALTVRVTGSSNRSAYPRGLQRVPAAAIARVALVEPPNITNHGTGVGVAAGGAAMAPVAFYLGASEKGPEWLGLLAVIGGAVFGGWVGHHFDRGKTVFVIAQSPGR
jgi:hypothetical protein